MIIENVLQRIVALESAVAEIKSQLDEQDSKPAAPAPAPAPVTTSPATRSTTPTAAKTR